MVVALVVCGVQPVEVCVCRECDGVAEESEVEVGVEAQLQLSGVLAYHP